jgi:hypothetical protein
MNRGYAFGFLLILLVVVLGFYVAYTSFVSNRDAIRARTTAEEPEEVAQASPVAQTPALADTSTSTPIPTPLPGITATLTAAILPGETGSPVATGPGQVQPTQVATRPPAQPTLTSTPAIQVPTALPLPTYQFRLAAPPAPDAAYPTCCYIVGTVRNAAGVPLENILVQASNEWITLDPAATKGGGEAGQYNIPLGYDAVAWNLIIVDQAGNQISTKVTIDFDPATANAIRIDWLQAY